MSCCLVQRGWDSSWQLLWWFEDKKICFTDRAKMRRFGPPKSPIPNSQCCLCSWQLLPLINLLLALISSHSFGREKVEAAVVQMDAAYTVRSFLWAAAFVMPIVHPSIATLWQTAKHCIWRKFCTIDWLMSWGQEMKDDFESEVKKFTINTNILIFTEKCLAEENPTNYFWPDTRPTVTNYTFCYGSSVQTASRTW